MDVIRFAYVLFVNCDMFDEVMQGQCITVHDLYEYVKDGYWDYDLLIQYIEITHKDTVNLVRAPAQAAFADKLRPHLSEEELAYYRRGKNSHVHAVPKSASPAEYARATGLEALFGALYLAGKTERLNELFEIMIREEETI